MTKILEGKAYGSIGHLPNSRLGPGDHRLGHKQAAILTTKERPGDRVIVQEKLDGSCMAVALVDGSIVAVGRAGYLAITSPHDFQHGFALWVMQRETLFRSILQEGERLVGEWLTLAHGTKYDLPHSPFVVFDLMRGNTRAMFDDLCQRIDGRLPQPIVLHDGGALSIADANKLLGAHGAHGAIDPAEGVVYRVERQYRKNRNDDDPHVDFLAKYVRQDKVDGSYLVGTKEAIVEEPVWNGYIETVPADDAGNNQEEL